MAYTTAVELGIKLCSREYHIYKTLIENRKFDKIDTIFKKNFHSYDDAVKFWKNFEKRPFCYFCGDSAASKYFHVFFDRMLCTADNLGFKKLLLNEGCKAAIDALPKNYVLKGDTIVKLPSLQPKNNSNQINDAEQLDKHPKETNIHSNVISFQDVSSTKMLSDKPIDSEIK